VNESSPTTAPIGANPQMVQDVADLNDAKTVVQETFETSNDWVAAEAAIKQAQTDYDDACGPVLDNLKTDPAYKAALDAQTTAQADLTNLQTTGQPDEISNAAQTLMQARSTVKAMEAKAIATDPSTVAAKQKLTAAFVAMTQLRQKEEDAVEADPTWIAAKKKLDAARAAN
jgi:hypothetical protein